MPNAQLNETQPKGKALDPRSYSYELSADTYGLDAPLGTSPDAHWFDEEHKAINIVFAASLDQDRIGDFLEVDGIVTSEHQKNPIVYLDHGDGTKLPIGKCVDPDGNYTVKVENGVASAKVYLDCGIPGFEEPEQVFELYKRKTLIGGSIGYRILDFDPIPANPERGYFRKAKHIKSCELLEVSVVAMPMNQDSVVKNLSTALQKSFARVNTCGDCLGEKNMESMSATDQSAGGSTVGEDHKKAGCVALKEMHAKLEECKDLASRHSEVVEHPHIRGLLEKMCKKLSAHHKDAAEAHNEHYPEEDRLDHEEEEGNEHAEEKALSRDDEAAVRQSIQKFSEKITSVESRFNNLFGRG